MTGRPLGPRTGSFGLLEQQAHNGVVLPKQSIFVVRKMSLSGGREREKLFPFMCRCLRRRKVGMLILTVFGFFAFVTGLFTVNNEFALESTGFKVGQSLQITGSFVCGENNSHLPPPNPHASAVPRDNPCKNFAFPPPPSDGRKRTGPRPCPVCYLPVEQAIASMPSSPSISPVLRHLTYFHEENPVRTEPHGGSDFGGYPSLERRNDSYIIKESMTLHCGFIKGCRPGYHTGFDIDEADLRELEEFHEVIVASAIFGNYDIIWQPKNLSETASKHVPFYMFIDEKTEAFMKNSSVLDSSQRVGFWRIIIVHNIPYADARRNGKVPKLLLHRLFPNVRYSIWIDGKLQLVVDPYQILERFLWRHNATFAISRHYRRFDVFEEAEANKAAGKYDNASIDHQIEFYKREGLTPYSVDKFPITSDVPEGCVIIREHIPITNLFACLWFNEVDRFTSRDQLSFSTVRDKIMAKVNWSVNMFMDCERRNFVIQGYHKELIDRMPPPVAQIYHQTALIRNNTAGRIPVKKNPLKNGRASRRSGSRHHCKVAMVVGATF